MTNNNNNDDDDDDDDTNSAYYIYESLNDNNEEEEVIVVPNPQDELLVSTACLRALDAEYQSTITAAAEAEVHAEDWMILEENYNSDWDSNYSDSDGDDDDNELTLVNSVKDVIIDVDAVRNAMSKIRLQHPKFSARLDERVVRDNNNILPPMNVCHQFIFSQEGSTGADVTSTGTLSRSATLAYAISRLYGLDNYPKKRDNFRSSFRDEKLCIHVIGCDHVECSSESSILTYFKPFVEWVFNYLSLVDDGKKYSNYLGEIELILIGPGISPEISKRFSLSCPLELELIPTSYRNVDEEVPDKTSSRATGIDRPQSKRAKISCVTDTYEEFASSQSHSIIPDIAIAFNAGIWGYSDWLPTLSYMSSTKGSNSIPFIITAYTLEEAGDDEDTISSHLECLNLTGHLLWEAEHNPYGSKRQRPTKSALEGRVYRENSAWQCWILGDQK